MLTVDSIIRAGPDQVSCDLGGETAILQLTEGVYYSLDAVGTRIWELIQQPIRVGELCDRIVGEFEVDRDRCENDLLELIRELRGAGLVEVSQ